MTPVQSGSPDVDSAWLEAFDALSGNRLITAEAFFCLAARVGLFNEGYVGRYPRVSRACKSSLHRLVKRDYRVRHATERDIERLCELERLCWQHTLSSKARIRARIANYPQGQFVLEREGRVLGVVYSQRIDSADELADSNAANVHKLHRAAGAVIQLLAVNIDPQVQNLRYGDFLLEFMLQRCSLIAGVRQVVGVTLCKRYDSTADEPFAQYILREGADRDPVLAFHHSHGASIVKTIPGYRPLDVQNETNGVLVSYDILDRIQKMKRRVLREDGAAETPLPMLDQEQVRNFLRNQSIVLLGEERANFGIDRPFMEMGLDSASLLQLQTLLEEACGKRLSTSFFFEFNTVEKVAVKLGHQDVHQPTAVRSVQPPILERKPAAIDIADTDIAIVGLSCRLPGGIETPADLWNVLAEGACVIDAYPDTRGRWPSPREWPAIDQGGFVRGLEAFDAAFFRISPLEAQMMDPQQRMIMELAWSCFEDANVRPSDVAGSDVGVFVGASNSDYSRLMQDAGTEVEAHLGVASSLAVIANRVSYFFDLSGPSLLVDTACSSSLVALHTAMQSLHRNECSAALVAGVNVICHPDLSLAYHKAGMLAADGRCKVFDSRADGYVRAEGAVVLLIKPLRRAIAEGDRIHAVVKGSAINHGGLASGLTVPNPVKQRELLMAAWDNAGVRSDELSYIEAHGTGTSLGDPIEVQGIQSAYAQRAATHTLQSCGLGSLKSNLGHLESAAGLAGMLKVILSMQHRQLPSTVNFESLNPKVELDDAFYIQSRLQDWHAPVRLAGVSSFGSGGANAHVVLQEFPGIEPLPENDQPQLFVLSAASRDGLREYARRVSAWLDQADGESGLRNAIYSWQVGRTPMKVRLALKVASRGELKSKLDAWVNDGKDPVHGWFADGRSDAASARLWQTKSARLLIDQALQEQDIDQLAVLWTSGIEIDWSRLYDRLPQRVNLPTYPFAKERHWIQAQERHVKTLASAQTSLHPLLHANVSDLSRQAFRSVLTGEEHFLRDHQVKLRGTDECVLPAVAYLEMARAAVEQAVPADARGAVLELRNCVWAQPLVVRGATPVVIALSGALDGEIEYEIVSGDGARRKDHCQGRAAYVPQTTPARLDVPMLRARMDRGALGADAVYATFEAMGLMYGPAHRAVRHVYQGAGQLLAQLELPSCVRAGADQYRMHPSLMDGALQACVGLMDASGQSRLPFAVDTVRVLGQCGTSMWVWVRYSAGSRDGDAVTKFDIDLSDEQGAVCVQMCGFSARALGPATATGDASASGVLRAVPQWRAIAEDVAQEAAPTAWAERHVVVCDLPGIEIDSLASLMAGSRCVMLSDSSAADLASRYSDYALSCFERIRAVLSGKPEGAVLMQVVVGESGEDAVFSGLSALLKTATLENPLFRGQLVLTGREVTTAALAQQLEQARAHASEPVIRFDRGTQPQGLGWQVQPQAQLPCEPVFKEHGVYLITGGLGGLGVLFAQAVLEQTRHGRVILTGRGALSGAKQSRLDALVALGAGRIRYRSLDLADRAQVEGAIAEILAVEGGL
ncbi:MAG: polyketide synthase dehydratase domain-containing protein, partial [Xanthomonadales bacterium]|nr:polyketide synthase dehydratase domain-containing protein [Xanthomonadales bacterium]